MATDPLGAGRRHNIGTLLDRLGQVSAHAKGVVDDERNASVVADIGNGFDIGHIELRVADRLNVHGPRLVVDQISNTLRVVSLDELARDVEFLHVHAELVVRAAVQVHGGDEIVARLAHRGDGHELSGMTTGSGNGADTAFQHGHSVLEDGVGGIAHARVHVAILGPSELAGPVGGVGEVVRTGLVQGYRAGAVDRIRLLSTVQGYRFIFGCLGDFTQVAGNHYV